MAVDNALFQWQDGQRRLDEADPEVRPLLERVTACTVDELRRRLGSAFTVAELADLYGEGTDWCLAIATAEAPDEPRAWDAQTVADAAFARYAREARDFGGGRALSG